MALMVTHPDYLMSDEGKRVYRDFLTHVAEHEGFWRALPRDVARWWREREAAQAALTAGEAVASPRATVAELRVAHGDLTFERLLGEERDEVPRA